MQNEVSIQGMQKTQKCLAPEYPGGIILPQKKVEEGPKWGLGGVCDKEGHFIESSYYDGGWATHGGYYDWGNEEDYINEDAVYIGMFFLHWGHFLIDLTNRLWVLPKLIKERRQFKVAYLGDEIPEGNNLRFFELLGVEKEQLYQVKKPTRFRNVIVPDQAFKSCSWYTEEHLAMLDCVVDKALSADSLRDKERIPKKVYFSRRHFSKAKVSEFGEEYIEKLFVQNGYQCLFPEELCLDEQIYVWNNATDIVCINGSIPLNLMFCRNQSLHLTVLNKTTLKHENPYILLEMRKLHAEFINTCKEPIKGYPKSLGRGPYLLWPTEEFDEYCQRENLVQPLNERKRNAYFNQQKFNYYRTVIGLKQKVRSWVLGHMPNKMKERIKKGMHVD